MSLSKNEQKIYELLKNRELYRNEKGIFTMCPQRLLIVAVAIMIPPIRIFYS